VAVVTFTNLELILTPARNRAQYHHGFVPIPNPARTDHQLIQPAISLI